MEYLYDHYSEALYGTAYKIVKTDQYAEEVLHDALLNVWEKINTYDMEKSRLFTWMLNIVRNKAIDKVRSAEYRRENKSDPIMSVVSKVDSTESTEQSTDAIGLSALVQKLTKEQQFVLEMIYYKGYTHSELAVEFDIPLGTVKTRLRIALKELREILKVE